MGQILIRNLDEDVVAELKRKASAAGTSLEQFMRDMCRRETTSDMDSYFRTRDLLVSKMTQKPSVDPAEMIRRSRDERGRYIYELSVLGEATFDPDDA
jgi:plasmid stability protein